MNMVGTGEVALPHPLELKGKVLELIRYASLSRLKIHTASEEISVKELDSAFKPGRILASKMVFILVSGDVMRITFKAHFNTRDAARLAFRIFRGDSPDRISEKQAVDYFKEYGNLVAGSIAALLNSVGIEMGISLPLCTRGFYEIFSDYTEKGLPIMTFSDFWKFEVGGHHIFCNALVEVMDIGRLERLIGFKPEDEVKDDDGEMDFL